MSEADWSTIYQKVTQAGLLPGRSVRERLLELPDIDRLVDAAKAIGKKGILDESALDALLIEMEPKPAKNTDKVVARTIAPVSTPEPTTAARIHDLDHYKLADFPMNAKDLDSEINVHFDITGKSVTEGKKEDINSCFSNRLKQIRKMILDGGLPNRPISANDAVRQRRRFSTSDDTCTIIGLVNGPRTTKNGHLIFSIEDNSGELTCLLSQRDEESENQEIVHAGLMPDDVIGVSGHFSQTGDLFYCENLHFPPLNQHQRRSSGEDQAVSAAFISDLHLGSKTFLESQWHKMIRWFNEDPLAQTIRYLVISGDGVDGVGIYPGQEKELNISDLFNQYSRLGEMLQELPDWVDVLLLPGNHDAVRPAEPQPALDPELQTDYNNTIFVGNPCDFSLHGVRVLSYHGVSIMDFVSSLRTVTFEKPEAAMRAMIDRRHLAPSWGGKTPLSPEPEDRLVISDIPDIFVTGHVHGHHTENYKGVNLVHSSTWQDQTSYQRMLGFQPKPCILTVVNLHTHATASIPFV
ncbi:MAG: DNA-directed DNA polymerase II small subunit [Candidatus Thalassarchaeaceae archaeon]|nr:DNA-directed DNA polymerase II small subunit [Candidatus Thalassarchaeaceae archaeon]